MVTLLLAGRKTKLVSRPVAAGFFLVISQWSWEVLVVFCEIGKIIILMGG